MFYNCLCSKDWRILLDVQVWRLMFVWWWLLHYNIVFGTGSDLYFLTLIVFCFTTEVKVLQDGNRNILNNVLQCICIKILSLSGIVKHWFLKYIRSKNSTYTCIGKWNCITMWWKIMCLFSHKNFKYSSVHIDLCIVYLCEFICLHLYINGQFGW